MNRKLHTSSKIFFPNPYVVRLDYENTSMEDAQASYRKTMRNAYRLFSSTWGYSTLEYEGAHMDDTITLNGLPTFSFITYIRGYACFSDELDALQFRLSLPNNAIQVRMWPKNRLFTIHEFLKEGA